MGARAGLALGALNSEQEGAEYDSSVVDTVYSDFPYIKRVYNWGSGGARTPSVPFVELDTNTYEKKLWFSSTVTNPFVTVRLVQSGKDS